MHIQGSRDNSGEQGFALIYMAIVLAVLLLFTGLAVDSGRAYVVKAQLTKAVDGAALAAARNLNSGNPKDEAAKIFKANFPAGYLGTTSSTDPTADPGFFSSSVNAATGVNTVVVSATATLPTTFMKLADINEVKVSSTGEATRRMVDLSLVLDGSSSIGSSWGAIADAARTFIDQFDPKNDRLALMTFSNGVSMLSPMSATRGFNKTLLKSLVPTSLPQGSTNMVEGLYRAWDQLRVVPAGQQSGLRVIVLFTDGASNSVPGNYDPALGPGLSLRTYDFPANAADCCTQTWNNPMIVGLFPTNSANSAVLGTPRSPSTSYETTVPYWDNPCTIAKSCVSKVPLLPVQSFHAYHSSTGMPTSFALQSSTLTVDKSTQSAVRGLRHQDASGRYPAEVFNINNAARNLVEIIADAARSDAGDYKIRIYTIGMGDLVRFKLGTRMEMSEDILKRIANDASSLDFNSLQLEGKYYFAPEAADVGPAFQSLQNQIVRLSK
jgi:Flp pilus assembly protein TadG